MMFFWPTIMKGQLNRARFVERYAGVPHNHKEDVAQHSYYVAMYALFLCYEMEGQGIHVDLADVLERALVHDLEESVTGDMLRSVKHGHAGLKAAMDEAGQALLSDMIEDTFSVGWNSKKQYAKERIMLSWRDAKNDTLEGAIVSLADLLGVVSYTYVEAELGSRYAATIRREITQNLHAWTEKYSSNMTGFTELCNIVTTVTANLSKEEDSESYSD